MGNFAKKARQRGLLLGLGVFLAVMALVAAAFRIAHNERAFELNRWETRLHTDAVQPAAMVDAWLSASRDALRAVAVNPTVQIYLSQAAVANSAAAPASPESEAQGAFLESYVISLGSRGPFAASPGAAGPDTGLAVLDSQRHVVAATSGYRPSPQTIAALIARMRDGSAGPLALSATDNSPNAFLMAVRPIQAPMSAPPVGYIVGERRLDETFWVSDGSVVAIDHGHESLVAVSPDGATHLVGSSVAGKAAANSGEYLAAKTPLRLQRSPDMKGRDALHLGVPVKGSDWILVESVPASSALAGVDARIRNLLTILLLSLLAIILGILALWRHMAGIQQAASREASMKLYRGVAEVLLQAIDERDPGAAEHSRRVAALSRDIALKMGAPKTEVDTAELAGALMNVGKLFVPVNLLTKAGELDEAEASQFAEGSNRWLDLLARTPFDPPLEPILRDAYHLGRGGMPKAGSVARTTYIIVVANKAVALMSPRAYRMAHSPAETIEILALDHTISGPIRAALADILSKRE